MGYQIGEVSTRAYPIIKIISPDKVCGICKTRHRFEKNRYEYEFCVTRSSRGFAIVGTTFGTKYTGTLARNYDEAMSMAKSPQSRFVVHTALVYLKLTTDENDEISSALFREVEKEEYGNATWGGRRNRYSLAASNWNASYGDTGHLINGCPRTKS